MDVWHWKDDEVQSVQMIRFTQEKRATLPAVYNVASGKLVPISDDVMRNVTPTPDPKWAIGRIDTTYRTEVHPTVVWAKFAAMREGAGIASARLWG